MMYPLLFGCQSLRSAAVSWGDAHSGSGEESGREAGPARTIAPLSKGPAPGAAEPKVNAAQRVILQHWCGKVAPVFQGLAVPAPTYRLPPVWEMD